jgi:hypothetical protein
MGIRIPEWAYAFFWFQQAHEFSVDARVLLLLGVAEHVEVRVCMRACRERTRMDYELDHALALVGAWLGGCTGG